MRSFTMSSQRTSLQHHLETTEASAPAHRLVIRLIGFTGNGGGRYPLTRETRKELGFSDRQAHDQAKELGRAGVIAAGSARQPVRLSVRSSRDRRRP